MTIRYTNNLTTRNNTVALDLTNAHGEIIYVRTDADGRYCLNDLHKAAVASGVTKDIRPNEWLSLQSTQEIAGFLITENPSTAPIVSKAGRYGGTFVVKELVYDYAMWISPAFHLKVINAYDRLATQGVAVHESAAEDLLENPLKYLEVLLGQAKRLDAAASAVLTLHSPSIKDQPVRHTDNA